MTGTTTELNLKTAQDSDDNADYLTLSLATSLQTLDALFNNVTGHNHNGAHQGGPVAGTSLPTGSISNDKLGPDVARANLLTNGGMEVWQRGNGPFTASGAYTADRWLIYIPAGGLSVSRDTANVDIGSAACMACTASGGTSSGSPVQVYQYPMTLADGGASLAGRTVSASVRVKASVANACRFQLATNPAGSGPVYSAYHSGSGAYQTLTATIVVPTNVAGFVLNIAVMFEAVGTFYVDNACLVVGSQPANYVPMHPADDLARCLRYYEKLGVDGDGLMHFTMNAASASYGNDWTLPFRVIKAVSPTITIVGTWLVSNAGQPSNLGSDVAGMRLRVVATSGGQFYANNGNAGNNIVAEANP